MALTKVSSKGIKDSTILNEDVNASANIAGSKLADNSISLAKLSHGDSNNNGKFLRANNGADPTFETVNTDLVSDTSPQLGGDLQSNGNDIDIADNDKAIFGTGGDLEIYHASGDNNSYIHEAGSGHLVLKADDLYIQNASGSQTNIKSTSGGAVDLSHAGSKKLETNSQGIAITGRLDCTQGIDIDASNQALRIGANQNLQLVYTGSEAQIKNVDASTPLKIKVKDGNEDAIICNPDGDVELYHNNSRKLETTSSGIHLAGANSEISFLGTGTCDHSIKSPSGTNDVVITANKDAENVTSNIIFRSSGSGGGSVTDKLKIHGNGNVTIPYQACCSLDNAVDIANITGAHNNDPIEFNTVRISQGGMSVSNSNSRITVPTAGVYLLMGQYGGSGNGSAGTDGMQLGALKNGSLAIGAGESWGIGATSFTSGAEWNLHFAVLCEASANDYFEMVMFNIDTNNAVNTNFGYFSVNLLH